MSGNFLSLARPAPDHLLEQDARLHRPQEHDVLQVGDVDAGSEQVHGDRDAGVGSVAELADALERAVYAARDLLDEGVSPAKHVAGQVDELVAVRGVGQVIDGEDQHLGQAAELLLVLVGVAPELLEDALVGVGSRDAGFQLGRIVLALVLHRVEGGLAGPRVDDLDVLAFTQEHPLHPYIGAHGDHVVVHEVSLGHRLPIVVAEDKVFEVRGGVRRGRGGQTDLEGIEVIERGTPDRLLCGGVAPVALVRDDDVEGVDRDVQRSSVLVGCLLRYTEQGGAAQHVDRHALDSADVDEGVLGLRIGEVAGRQQRGVEGLVVAEVLLLETVAVDLVDAVELETRLGLERGECPHGLGGQRPAIDEEQHAPCRARLHQAVDLVDGGEGLAGASGHRDQHRPLALRDGLLDGLVRRPLVGSQALVVVGPGQQVRALAVEVTSQQVGQRSGRVEAGNPPRTVERVTDVVEPDHLAVRRVEERDVEPREVEGVARQPARVALGLGESVLGADGEALGLDDADDAITDAQGVVCWSVCGRMLLGSVLARSWEQGRTESPARSIEQRIDPALPGLPLRLHRPATPGGFREAVRPGTSSL